MYPKFCEETISLLREDALRWGPLFSHTSDKIKKTK